MDESNEVYSIGIDIGTTSIKCCALGSDARVISEKSAVHDAWIKRESHIYREQDPLKIFHVLLALLKSMKLKYSSNIIVSIVGQMHGIVFWNGQNLTAGKFICSPLITWMDERVPKEFVNSLPRWNCGELHVGFGMVTLAWLHSSDNLKTEWTCCGTVMDMLISYLSQSSDAFIGVQNAYSWGYCSYDGYWTLPEKLIPPHLLPTIRKTDEVVGLVKRSDFDLPVGAQLLSSCGDLQSTVYPVLETGTAVFNFFKVLNLGTSAQLCFASEVDQAPSTSLLTEPFFGNKRLIVAASMNGGNAIDIIAQKMIEWASELVSDNKSLKVDYNKLNDILTKPEKCTSSVVRVEPIFLPERGSTATSCISGISPRTTVNEVFQGIACGIVCNLFRLLPPQELQRWNVKRVILAGNANKTCFVREITQQCEGRLQILTGFTNTCSAAYGAALRALHVSRL
ncbi:unnamed protein product [Thelazia callipaeda]|uniref:FGGY_N domain-containing protein n=1 Tax=Thelazia callipaeda TaxID=103827 RepID=A0A158RCB3_THECL|nr:unnamed protein product [Thelazia callipaeda]